MYIYWTYQGCGVMSYNKRNSLKIIWYRKYDWKIKFYNLETKWVIEGKNVWYKIEIFIFAPTAMWHSQRWGWFNLQNLLCHAWESNSSPAAQSVSYRTNELLCMWVLRERTAPYWSDEREWHVYKLVTQETVECQWCPIKWKWWNLAGGWFRRP